MNSSTLSWALKQTARRLSVDSQLVEAVYRSYWGFVKDRISSIQLETMSQEEFDAATTNFNIPFIGKLYTDYDKITKYNNHLNYYNNAKAKKN